MKPVFAALSSPPIAAVSLRRRMAAAELSVELQGQAAEAR
jgi:hypothetical protein